MRKVTLYIASSLDGYIAKSDGSLRWLEEFPNPDQSDFGYSDFLKNVDTLLMGGKTYRQVLTFGDWPYVGKQAYVFSRNPKDAHDEYATFVSGDVVHFVSELRQKQGKTIWLVGGGEINSLLLQNNLIDEIILTLTPVALGEGIPLFGKGTLEKNLMLKSHQVFKNGMVQLTYTRQNNLS